MVELLEELTECDGVQNGPLDIQLNIGSLGSVTVLVMDGKAEAAADHGGADSRAEVHVDVTFGTGKQTDMCELACECV